MESLKEILSVILVPDKEILPWIEAELDIVIVPILAFVRLITSPVVGITLFAELELSMCCISPPSSSMESIVILFVLLFPIPTKTPSVCIVPVFLMIPIWELLHNAIT